MPISFDSIPLHIKLNLVEKLGLKEFVATQLASDDCNKVGNRVRTFFDVPKMMAKCMLIAFHGNEMEVKLHNGKSWHRIDVTRLRFEAQNLAIQGNLTDERCQIALSFFYKTGSTAHLLNISNVSCPPALLRELVDIANVKSVAFMHDVLPEYVTSLSKPDLTIFGTSPLKDDDFMKLNEGCFAIHDTQITSFGLNTFIRELLEGKRRIDHCVIVATGLLVTEDVFREIPYSESSLGLDFYVTNDTKIFNITLLPAEGMFSMSSRKLKKDLK